MIPQQITGLFDVFVGIGALIFALAVWRLLLRK
jgi:hypothetical protein